MNTLAIAIALIAIFSAAIIYGTDIFSALILRPAATGATDTSVADLIGRIHEYGDRRQPIPGILSIIAAALAIATSNNAPARIGAAIALVALLLWLASYLRISAAINKRLREAAASHTVPSDTRTLQQHWDSVIWARAALQTIALASLLTTLITQMNPPTTARRPTPTQPDDRAVFLLPQLGQHVADRFARALAPMGRHPAHFGVLRTCVPPTAATRNNAYDRFDRFREMNRGTNSFHAPFHGGRRPAVAWPPISVEAGIYAAQKLTLALAARAGRSMRGSAGRLGGAVLHMNSSTLQWNRVGEPLTAGKRDREHTAHDAAAALDEPSESEDDGEGASPTSAPPPDRR